MKIHFEFKKQNEPYFLMAWKKKYVLFTNSFKEIIGKNLNFVRIRWNETIKMYWEAREVGTKNKNPFSLPYKEFKKALISYKKWVKEIGVTTYINFDYTLCKNKNQFRRR